MTDPAPLSPELSDDVAEGAFSAVREGYEAVYDALGASETFNRIWRDTAYGGQFPAEFAHIGFLTITEAERLLEGLGLRPGGVLADLACGAGGPGLWAAQQSEATLIGVDPAAAGLAAARQRAERVGLAGRAQFRQGSFERTGLDDASVDAVMSIEAFQYAPDKRAALGEVARILKPGSRAGIVCFEVDPAKVKDLPVLGVDPVSDYTPLLTGVGLSVRVYEETPGWAERVYPTFAALLGVTDALYAEMGESAASSVLLEAALTVSTRPYLRRVLIVAERSP